MRTLFAILAVSLLLVAACAKAPPPQQPAAQGNASVQSVDSNLADIDNIDKDLNTSDLDTLDSDLNFG